MFCVLYALPISYTLYTESTQSEVKDELPHCVYFSMLYHSSLTSGHAELLCSRSVSALITVTFLSCSNLMLPNWSEGEPQSSQPRILLMTWLLAALADYKAASQSGSKHHAGWMEASTELQWPAGSYECKDDLKNPWEHEKHRVLKTQLYFTFTLFCSQLCLLAFYCSFFVFFRVPLNSWRGAADENLSFGEIWHVHCNVYWCALSLLNE